MNTIRIARFANTDKRAGDTRIGAGVFRLRRLRPVPKHLVPLFALLLVLLVSCSALQGQPSGYAAIIYLNRTSFLIQGISALAYQGQPPIVWVNAVAPGSWEPLLFDCGFTQVSLVSVIPIDLTTGQEGETVEFNLDAMRDGHELMCGSLVVVTISETPNEQGPGGLTLSVERFPDPLPETVRERPSSALNPGAASGLILLRSVASNGVPTQIVSGWERPSGRVFVARVNLEGRGPSAATLLECPVVRVGWGNFTDPSVPGAILTDTETAITAPVPLTSETGLACGVSVTLQAARNPEKPDETVLSTELVADRSDVPRNAPDLFGAIRRVLDTEGFAGKLSSNLALFPEPGITSTAGKVKARPPAVVAKPTPNRGS